MGITPTGISTTAREVDLVVEDEEGEEVLEGVLLTAGTLDLQ
jgi:hypothetical protein